MKRIIAVFTLCFLFAGMFSGCGMERSNAPADVYYEFTDDIGRRVTLAQKPERVVSLFGSYSEMWLLSGGELAGVTEDTVSERGLSLDEDVQVIGSVQHPNLELILELSPDFILLSADLSAHKELDATLTEAKLPHAYLKMDDVDEYLHVLEIFTGITQKQELYEQYGSAVKSQIDTIIENVPADAAKPKILLIRSMSAKAKALKEDHMVGRMLMDLGTDNIASRHDSLLEELSLETILDEDPDFIFVIPMGNVDSAIQTLGNGITANPAWNSLSAVKNNRYFVLPKDLFQYKPNARWGESYEYLCKILYP